MRPRAGKKRAARGPAAAAPAATAAIDPRIARAAALGLAVAAFALAAFLSRELFSGLPRVGDEVSYALQGRIFSAGRLYLAPPPVPEAFAADNVILTADRWCGKYPPGFPLLLAAGWLAGAPWLVNPLLYGLAVYGVYRLGAKLYDDAIALTASLLFASLPFAFLQAASFMAHMASGALAIWTLALLAEGYGGRPARRLLAAGLLAGFAFLVRPVSAVLLLAVPALLLLALRFPRGTRLRAAGFVVAGSLLPLAFLLWFQWRSFGSPFVTGYAVFDPAEGFLGNRHGSRPLAAVVSWNLPWYAERLPAALWAVPGSLLLALVLVLVKARKEDLVVAAAALGLVAGHLGHYFHDVLYGGPRFAFEATAFLALLLARALANGAGFLDRPASWPAPRRAALRAGLALAAAGLLGAATVAREGPLIRAHARTYMGVPNAPLEGAERAGVGPDALVLVDLEDPVGSLDDTAATSPAFAGYLFRNALDPAAGRRVFARALPGREGELAAAYPRAETWKVVVRLSLPREGEAPMNGPSVLHGLRWSRIR